MSDTPERSVNYQPEEGAEVRPAPRYNIAPAVGFEALPHDVAESPYQTLSVLAVAGFVLAVLYSLLVALGGIAAFWASQPWLLLVGAILVPLLSIPVARKFNVRGWPALLRVAGLALVAFFALPIGIGGLFAFPSQSPWLLPLWTLAFALAAVGVAAAGRLRIRASEGTLSGLGLTTWAILLSVFFALCYTAFYSATYLAVTFQAKQFTNDWIDRIQKDDLERAFTMTLEPQFRDKNTDTLTRAEVESVSLRQMDPEGRGGYSAFCERPAVRLLRGSTRENVELLSIGDWGYETGGYKVVLHYQVTTPYWSFPLDVVAFGTESPKGDWRGRRWTLQANASNLTRITPTVTPKGNQLLALGPPTNDFLQRWTNDLWMQRIRAVNPTLPEGSRDKDVFASVSAAPAAAGFGVRARQFQAPFFKGVLVKEDEANFWVAGGPDVRKQLVEKVKAVFAPGQEVPDKMRVQIPMRSGSAIPLWSEENGRLVLRHDVDIIVPVRVQQITLSGQAETKQSVEPDFRIEAYLIVSCPAAAAESAGAWRIDGVELIRAQRLEERQAGPTPRRP